MLLDKRSHIFEGWKIFLALRNQHHPLVSSDVKKPESAKARLDERTKKCKSAPIMLLGSNKVDDSAEVFNR